MIIVTDRVNSIRDSHIRLGTLGPEGTSSEYVAKKFIKNHLESNNAECEIKLYDTFEEAREKLLDGSINYIICPHAYKKINDFYMHPLISLIEIFQCDTPMYGVAVRQDYSFENKDLEEQVIVSHSAPLELVINYLGKKANFHIVNSTSKAAELISNGNFNLAVTNEEAVKKFGLKFVYEFKKISMSWSLFGRI
ncbi:hypothetical protein J8655_17665 [Dickeya oryzae]|uniref:hypothetical protein n=1 Tax=Dickeya oryzae TaxID=1240404 RepID=UPI001AEC97CA|nr:hypothetical protein [Dickeya oryzae]MBP2847281.1 hypothetical protein [Dickeya oryzae]